MRRHYSYEFEICDITIDGTYVADCGQLDTVALPCGTEVAIKLDGSAIDAGQGDEALTLARLIAKRIMRNPMCQSEMDQTRAYEPWSSHAPTVI